jgi:transposase-like protein
MDNNLLTSLDQLNFREWTEITSDTKKCIDFCQRVGLIVEIDESAWTKRKYNRGRQVSNQWVFGGIDRDSRDCFAVMVDRRDADTLLPIINQYILPGTTIYSDQWAAYNGIASGPHPQKYVHLTVNHSQNFVDPVTRTHTQNIENLWMCMKIKKRLRWVNMFLFLILT